MWGVGVVPVGSRNIAAQYVICTPVYRFSTLTQFIDSCSLLYRLPCHSSVSGFCTPYYRLTPALQYPMPRHPQTVLCRNSTYPTGIGGFTLQWDSLWSTSSSSSTPLQEPEYHCRMIARTESTSPCRTNLSCSWGQNDPTTSKQFIHWRHILPHHGPITKFERALQY